ncbi:MAG: hypothetical protein ACE5K7_08050 [Phycisphaerae bacterium]
MKRPAGGSASRQLLALGRRSLPPEIVIGSQRYGLLRVLKHDFFAATGLYGGPSGAVVLKLGREQEFLGLPLRWLGRYLIQHEAAVYEQVSGLEGVPRFLGRWSDNGLLHEYVEGHPLDHKERVDDQFFDRLEELLGQLHSRSVAYVDLNKRENIIVGQDGRPYLIDFQISLRWPQRWGPPPGPARWVLKMLQRADRYHLAKHVRRHRPDLIRPEHLVMSQRAATLIRLHRWSAAPFTRLRRHTLRRIARATGQADGRTSGD